MTLATDHGCFSWPAKKKNCASKFCFSFLNPFPSEYLRNDLVVEGRVMHGPTLLINFYY